MHHSRALYFALSLTLERSSMKIRRKALVVAVAAAISAPVWAQVAQSDQVEVLRGPQATLYGAGSMGGTIKFVPNEPDLKEREFTTYTEASSTKGGSMNYAANVVGNFPLIKDELALRMGVQVQHTGGFI